MKSPRSQTPFERIKAIRRKRDFEKDADINEVLDEALLRIFEKPKERTGLGTVQSIL
jgi:hypothetical protein